MDLSSDLSFFSTTDTGGFLVSAYSEIHSLIDSSVASELNPSRNTDLVEVSLMFKTLRAVGRGFGSNLGNWALLALCKALSSR
jgi:hypothetical protein